jgi:hypothetical protein
MKTLGIIPDVTEWSVSYFNCLTSRRMNSLPTPSGRLWKGGCVSPVAFVGAHFIDRDVFLTVGNYEIYDGMASSGRHSCQFS